MKKSSPQFIQFFAPFRVPAAERLREVTVFFELLVKLQALQVESHRKNFSHSRRLHRRAFPILLDVFAGRLEPLAARERLQRLRLSHEDMRAVREMWDRLAKARKSTPAELETERKDLHRQDRLLAAARKAGEAGDILVSAASKGDVDALRHFVEQAISSVHLLILLERLQPDAIRRLSRSQLGWPILIDRDSREGSVLSQKLSGLELGADFELLNCRLRRARGADENYPARIWATEAVRTLEETRMRSTLTQTSLPELKLVLASGGCELRKAPDWVRAANELPPFSEASLPDWKKVIRAMIRQQIPAFHTDADWQSQRNTARQNGRNTVGQLQNAVLDHICSALKRLAPSASLPKSAC